MGRLRYADCPACKKWMRLLANGTIRRHMTPNGIWCWAQHHTPDAAKREVAERDHEPQKKKAKK